MSRIVVCGHLCLDVIPTFLGVGAAQDWARPGRLTLMGAPVIATGGAVSNVGLTLNRLGVPVRLAARIGDDPLGMLVLDRINAGGADLTEGVVRMPGEITSYSVVLNPPSVDRSFLHCPGANDTFGEGDVSDATLSDAALFHFGYPPLMKSIWADKGVGLTRLFQRARTAGALTSLDMSLPDPSSPSGAVDWGSYLARVLAHVDLFLPSIEELVYMMDRDEFARLSKVGGGEGIIQSASFELLERLSDSALRLGASAVLIKLGDRGAYLRTGPRGVRGTTGWENRELYSPPFSPTRVAGTTGAGDSTIAGFLASIFKGLSPVEALNVAVAVGACCVEAPDATSGIRTWDETVARIDAGWKKSAVGQLTENGWKKGTYGIWTGPLDRP